MRNTTLPRGTTMKFKMALLMATLMLLAAFTAGNVSAQTVAPAAPTGTSAVNGSETGQVIVSWNAVADAAYYRIGWVAKPDYEATVAAGRDWLEAFHFLDAANTGQTQWTLTRLSPGVDYYFIVASNDNRNGVPQYGAWSNLLTLTAAPPVDYSNQYPNCDVVRAHHPGGVKRGSPIYRPALDPDGDGNACEPTSTGSTPTPEPTPTPASIYLSDDDNTRGYNLTVSGSGFNSGSSATVYVLNTGSAPSSCQALIANSSSVAVGSATVGSDGRVAVSFAVAVPPFGGGQNNFICMADGSGLSSNDIKRFHLQATIRAVPSAASVGATVTVFAQDFPNPGAAFTGITLADQPVTGASGTSIGDGGSATATFTVPDGFNGVVVLRAQWGETSKTTRMRITP